MCMKIHSHAKPGPQCRRPTLMRSKNNNRGSRDYDDDYNYNIWRRCSIQYSDAIADAVRAHSAHGARECVAVVEKNMYRYREIRA